MLHELTICPNVDKQGRDASSAAYMFNDNEKVMRGVHLCLNLITKMNDTHVNYFSYRILT